MKQLSYGSIRTWGLVLLCLVGLDLAGNRAWGQAVARSEDAAARSPEVASVEQLKTEAFKALRGGQFDRSSELLGKAAQLARQDSQLGQMAAWTQEFESQRQVFQAERRQQYDKTVGYVQLLVKNQKPDYALDYAATAYSLSDAKPAFHDQAWVRELIGSATQRATQYETDEQWAKALRLYSALASLEPSKPLWKEKLKVDTRRLNLLALYNPDALKVIQQAELKERQEVDRLVNPTTQPATKPVAEEEGNDAFRTNWKEVLAGITRNMLEESLVHANQYYYRDTNYRELLLGGLAGIKTLATTKELEPTFASLRDANSRESFVQSLDAMMERLRQGGTGDDDTARTLLRNLSQLNDRTVKLPEAVWVSEFADGALGQLDPFSGMIWPAGVEEFNKTTQGEFSGVGIQIQNDDDGSIRIVSPLEDSPAFRAGIRAGDSITHINGKPARGITLNQAVKTITGERGTYIRLTVRSPDGTSKEYNLQRDIIHVASVKGWRHLPMSADQKGGGWDYLVDSQQKIAYVRITNFTRGTKEELNDAIEEMKAQGARAMILDLRYNPGGLLTAATDVSDKFLTKGTIVSTRPDRETNNQSTQVIEASRDGKEFTLPLVVLVNQISASASEIVSGALKDDKRAMIVGERTYGKGSVQMLFPVTRQRDAYLKLTTSHYYLPSGRCIHREENSTEWGVDPDMTVEMTPEQMRAAIAARQEMDVLHDANAPAQDRQEALKEKAPQVEAAVKDATKKKDPLATDPQLSAALLLLRLQLNGAQL